MSRFKSRSGWQLVSRADVKHNVPQRSSGNERALCRSKFSASRACLIVLWLCFPAFSTGQLRIVSYNTTPTVNDGLSLVLESIGTQTVNGIQRPIDILALQEQPSQQAETQAMVDILNAIYGPGVYARGTINGAGFFTQGVVYNTQTVELINEKRVGTVSPQGAARQTLRYRFRPVGYDANADFYVYNSHLKANDTETDANRRGVEATNIRTDADRLGSDDSVIFLGDFNLYRDTEPAFQTFLQEGNAQVFDPINRMGRWNKNSQFVDVHTQSTTVRSGENRAGGGVNDRFDFQLVTAALMDGEGLSYIGPSVPNLSVAPLRESYRAFGNNGTHFRNRDISTGRGASPAVLAALESASDHLPVVVDYQVPARMDAQIDYPNRILVDAHAEGIATVWNSAAVDVSIGADELEYSLVSLSGININEQGTVLARQPANVHSFELPSDAIGFRTATLIATSDSPEVANRFFQQTIEYQVLDHANASFDPNADVNRIDLDLGTFSLGQVGDRAEFELTIHNLDSQADLTAGLRLLDAELSTSPFRISIPDSLISAGESQVFHGFLDISQPGDFRANLIIPTVDESIPGSSFGAPLSVLLSALVSSNAAGDFNKDGLLSAIDIDLLTSEVRASKDQIEFDLNQDGRVDNADRIHWVEVLKETYLGDSNLDGQFDSRDFITVFQAGEYRDDHTGNSIWSTGDWDGDGEFETSDLILAFQRDGYEKGLRESFIVPEPGGCLSVLLLLSAMAWFRRQI